MKIAAIVFFLSSQLFSQSFTLVLPEASELSQFMEENNCDVDEIYCYLLFSYNETSEQRDITKYDYEDYSICAFSQRFEHGIEYSTNSCEEGKGGSTQVSFPEISQDDLTKLVEMLYIVNRTQIKNGWNQDHSKYEPVDKGAGCYYQISHEKGRTTISLWCGC